MKVLALIVIASAMLGGGLWLYFAVRYQQALEQSYYEGIKQLNRDAACKNKSSGV